jgi:hypothetical protein
MEDYLEIFLFVVVIYVFPVTALMRAFFGVAIRLVSGSWKDGFFRILAAHTISLVIVAAMWLAGVGEI